ncbi:unnamed protein product [Boreogadus saida]
MVYSEAFYACLGGILYRRVPGVAMPDVLLVDRVDGDGMGEEGGTTGGGRGTSGEEGPHQRRRGTTGGGRGTQGEEWAEWAATAPTAAPCALVPEARVFFLRSYVTLF